ncbi:MAG: hypothetical protein M1365_15185 [Actinobacteria bacterium]|nr:hypothetical protein [Actinomycetota bacterium]
MHKIFYASGFLYHSSTEQILLQQYTSSSLKSPWFLFSGLYTEKEEPCDIFRNIIYNLLYIKIKTVHPVYSYLNENINTNQFIVYSKLKTLKNFYTREKLTFAWFTFKEVARLHITEQTKHDICIGQRVIDAAGRKSRGEQTFQ